MKRIVDRKTEETCCGSASPTSNERVTDFLGLEAATMTAAAWLHVDHVGR
jgi:hypothetical protein